MNRARCRGSWFPPRITRRNASARTPRGGVFVTALAVHIIVAGCNTPPDHLRRDIQERRLAQAGVEAVDPTGTAASAGMSIFRPLDVPPLNPRRIGSDTTSRGFQRYIHRCGTCHPAPDPSIRTSAEWKYVFPRMEKHMEKAGLIPLAWNDRTLILGFLERHGSGGKTR